MTVRRLLLTSGLMAVVALALRALTAPQPSVLVTLSNAAAVGAGGVEDDVVLAVGGVLAWAVWAWGALGLALTAASAAPGAAGSLARGASRLVLPASLRTASGIALGVGLVVTAPAAAAAPGAEPTAVAVPDWPSSEPPTTPPDWPSAAPTSMEHVVRSGDCLWRIAEDRLLAGGLSPTDAEVARAVDRWWSVNADVIGPDPDLIRPGQVLLPPPGAGQPSTEHPYRSTP